VTIAREYGSGGSDIGRKVAELLGWMCVDKQIIERVSAIGKVEPSWAEKADEHASARWELASSSRIAVQKAAVARTGWKLRKIEVPFRYGKPVVRSPRFCKVFGSDGRELGGL
jgi:hypothetical protein